MLHPVHERLDQLARQYDHRRSTIFDVHILLEGDSATIRGLVLDPHQHAAVLALAREHLSAMTIDDQLVVALDSPEYGWATVARGVADVRATPGHAKELVTQTMYGEAVEVLAQDVGWCRVRLRDGYVGWVVKEALIPAPATTALSFRDTASHVVNVGWLPVHGSDGEQISLLPWGTELPILEFREGRAFFVSPAGQPCSITADGLLPLAERPPVSAEGCLELVNRLRQFIGVPYLWGGITPFGYDCSGLVQAAYGFLGRQLPRDADQQSAAGPPVQRAEIQPGDLIFWSATDLPAGQHNQISHVTLALDSETVIHANQFNWAVAIEPLAVVEERYKKRGGVGIVGIRRIVTQE